MLSSLQKSLLNDFQRDFPLSARPFAVIADAIGVSEAEVLSALSELNERQLISRIGPVIQPNRIGTSILVTMAVPECDLQMVAEIISAFPEINHNYEREHRINLWFVVIASGPRHLEQVLDAIERQTGMKTLRLPLLEDFFIDLGFQLDLSHD